MKMYYEYFYFCTVLYAYFLLQCFSVEECGHKSYLILSILTVLCSSRNNKNPGIFGFEDIFTKSFLSVLIYGGYSIKACRN